MISRTFENVWKLIREHKFQTISQIKNDLICTICNKLTIKTCYSPCGCIYCSDCIESYLDGKNRFCPGKSKCCRTKMINFEKNIFIDYPRNIRISEIIVKCPNKCEFTDELSLIENHIITCNKNPRRPYFENICKNNQVTNSDMKDHPCTEIYCRKKLMDLINNLRSEMESIKDEIVKLKSENEFWKDELEIIKIKSINNQMDNEKLRKKIVENLSEIEELNGKMVVVKNENQLLMNKLENLKKTKRKSEQQISEIDEIKVKRQQKSNKQMEIKKPIDKVIDNYNQIELLQRKSEQQISEIDEIKVKRQQKSNKQMEIKKPIDKVIDNYNQIELLNKSNNDCENKIDLPIKIVEIETDKKKNNYGKFKWKIENFSLNEKIDIFSDAFYSHRNGYKMCLSVWLDGDVVQVWFYLMKGEFDEELVWPFKHCITIDIINQKSGMAYTSKTINCNDHPNDQRWNKPITERNCAIYFYSAKKSKEIIKNNQLVIKCKISTQ